MARWAADAATQVGVGDVKGALGGVVVDAGEEHRLVWMLVRLHVATFAHREGYLRRSETVANGALIDGMRAGRIKRVVDGALLPVEAEAALPAVHIWWV